MEASKSEVARSDMEYIQPHGYDPGQIKTLNHGTIAQTGYMQSSKDWKNVEMTGYVKVNSGQSGENFAWYARGGRHTGRWQP